METDAAFAKRQRFVIGLHRLEFMLTDVLVSCVGRLSIHILIANATEMRSRIAN
jgi:hypothetical protein